MSSRNPRSSGGRAPRQPEPEDGYPRIPEPRQSHFGHLLAFLSVLAVLGFGFWAAFNTLMGPADNPAPKAVATVASTTTPSPASVAAPTAAPTAVGAAPKAATGTPAAQAPGAVGSSGVYVIQSGDTLYGIARKYETTVDDLMAANGITDRNKTLRVGDKLNLP